GAEVESMDPSIFWLENIFFEYVDNWKRTAPSFSRQLKSPPHNGRAVAIAYKLDSGVPRYPRPRFVNFLRTFESAAISAQTGLLALRKPLLTFSKRVLPAIASNPLFACGVND
ncbi:hypothetical protein HPB47_026526, partial [Ixodes persulcatus]